MNYLTKYLKYKNKMSQTGGVLYIYHTRMPLEILSEPTKSMFVSKAKQSQKYFNTKTQKGIDPMDGPKGFDVKLLDIKEFGGEISYETYTIVKYLQQINQLLQPYKIHTIQSQPSWLIDDSYFQIPFIEFEGNPNSVQIFREMYDMLDNCLSNTNISKNAGKSVVRFCILRPFIRDYKLNSDFLDTDFWEKIVDMCDKINKKNIYLTQEFIENKWIDDMIDTTKDIYLLSTDKRNKIIQLHPRYSHYNPWYRDVPLSIIYCRQEHHIKTFFLQKVEY